MDNSITQNNQPVINIAEYINNLKQLKKLTADILTEYKVKNKIVESSLVIATKYYK